MVPEEGREGEETAADYADVNLEHADEKLALRDS